MSIASWRRLLLALCASALGLTGINLWMVTAYNVTVITGSATSPYSVTGTGTGTAFIDSIVVPPASPAFRAGLRTGDLVDARQLSAADRYRWLTGFWVAGERMQLPILRGNAARRISMTAESAPLFWDVWLSYIGAFWMVLFAALIVWRRAESVEARTLALTLVLYNIGTDFFPIDWITRWPGVDAGLAAFGVIPYYAGLALFATYAMLFARPPMLFRRILAWLSYGFGGVAALYGIAYVAGVWTLSADPNQTWYSGWPTQLTTGVLPYLFPWLCVLVAVGQARGTERARLVWASASLGLLYVFNIVSGMLVAFDPSFNSRLLLYASNIVDFIAPIGLTYSLLNRRLLDIGFAVNRAAVFSGVSIVVVGIFVLAEWILSEWFRSAGHMTNLAISAALALGLGLSVRAIHARVDRVLDSVFFRKRHEDERRIRAFGQEAAYITDAGVLLARARETLEAHADSSFVTLPIDNGAGRYGDVSENDPAIVALRTWREVLDLCTVQTELRGEFAYPMIARGRLVGALVLGPKRSGDSYAPDESDAIAQLALGVGGALDVISMNENSSPEPILAAIRALSVTLSDATRSLPEAIAERLRENEQA